MRAEAHPQALDEVDQRLLLEAPRPVERHVLDEVREPPLVVVLQHRAGVDHQPQLGAVLRVAIGADIPRQPVLQLPGPDRRIKRNAGSIPEPTD